MVDIKEKKAEAIRRMKLIGLLPRIIEEFEKKDVVNYSETTNQKDGILYWLANKMEWLEFVKAFEEKHKALVYHAEFSHLEFGDCLSLFYVGNYEEEWERDYNDLKDGYAFVYVWNIDDNFCSEFGTIGFKSVNGGVKRTA